MSISRRELDHALARAERTIALLDRCRPTNGASERERLLRAFERGAPVEPRWTYRPVTGIDRLRAALEVIALQASEAGPLGELYAERALELAEDAAVGERIGLPGLRECAARRFPIDSGEDGQRAEQWATEWAREATPHADRRESGEGERVPSDDERHPESMLAAMQRAVGEHRLPFRVVLSPDLPCAAATGEDVIVVRAGVSHRRHEVRRVVVHEVLGHALPRYNARREPLGLFAVGTRQGPDDEEGRALVLERRHGFLDAARRAELARRHRAAISVRQGATWVETARLVAELGATDAQAVDIASRTHRGGGLGRESVYLVALSRVERALEADPALEHWMTRGRIAVAAVPALAALGALPDVLSDVRAA